jgi:hypothetical protein
MLLKTVMMKIYFKPVYGATKLMIARVLVALFFVSQLSFVCYGREVEPANVKLLKQAIAKRQAGKHNQAIVILQQLKRSTADHKRINVELVINQIKLGHLTKAQALIVELQGMNLSAPEAIKLTSLQQLVDKYDQVKTTGHKFYAALVSAVGIDNFTSKFPSNDYVDFFEWEEFSTQQDADTFELATDGRTELQVKNQYSYNSQQVKLNYKYSPDQVFSLFAHPTQLIWLNSGSYMSKQLNNDYDSRNQQVKLDTRLVLLQKKRWVIDLKLRYMSYSSQHKKLLDEQSTQVSLALPFGATRLKFGLEYQDKSFKQNYVDNDATVMTAWLEYSRRLSPKIKVSFGAKHRKYQGEDVYNSYDNSKLFSTLGYTPRSDLSTFITINYNKLHYEVDDVELVGWGREIKHSVILGIKYAITKHISVGLNSHYRINRLDRNNGSNEWSRYEGFIKFSF